jgi:hypothetical protein
MNFIKRFLSIASYVFCFLTAIVLLVCSFDNSTTFETKIYVDIFLFIVGFLSFVLAKWLWGAAKVATSSNPTEVSESNVSTPNSGKPRMFEKLTSFLVNDNELDSTQIKLLSLVFLLISGVMSFFEYTHHGWLWNSKLTFQPDMVSTILAIVLR